jgi:hypothetical protein
VFFVALNFGGKFTANALPMYKYLIASVLILSGFRSGAQQKLPTDSLAARNLRPIFLQSQPVLFSLQGKHLLTKDHYVQQLPFTCATEYKFEKRTGIPLRLRLGSLEYCNKLEGKK